MLDETVEYSKCYVIERKILSDSIDEVYRRDGIFYPRDYSKRVKTKKMTYSISSQGKFKKISEEYSSDE